MLNKRGQLTIFIILGILVVVAVLAAIFLLRPEFFRPGKQISQPNTFEHCAKQGIDQAVLELALTAGFTGSYFNKTYNDIAIPYVCYSDEYYEPCVVQAPFLEEEFKKSLGSRLDGRITECYNNYIEEFKRSGYDVEKGDISIDIDLQKEKIKLKISTPIMINDGSSSTTIQDIEFEVPTKIYDVIMLANNIVKYETTHGEYELVQSQLLYPDLIVNAIKLGDETVIYIINDQEAKYQFAIRSYARPPGYGF
jgi:hypothetical protein